jgi:hypothetical protein
MKTKIFVLNWSIFIGLSILLSSASTAQEVSVDVYAFSSEPLIDGIIDEVWEINDYIQISHQLMPVEPVASDDFSGRFKIGWYNNMLYFLFVVTDDIFIPNEGQPIWLGDNINIYLDLGNEKDSSYDENDHLCHYKWGNSDYYEKYDGTNLVQINNHMAVEFAQVCDPLNNTFVMEIAFRFLEEFHGPSVLDESTSIGLDAGIYDLDDSIGMFSAHLSWVDTTGLAWSDPSRLGTAGFGTIMLKEAKEPNIVLPQKKVEKPLVFPTLTSESLTIRSGNYNFLHVEIFDLLGNRVIAQPVSEEKAQIDVSQLQQGIYFIRVFNSGRLVGAEKIIVHR